MAAPTLASLLAAKTADQVKASILAALTAAGFPVTDWESGGVARTLIEAFAKVVAEVYRLIAFIVGSGFVAYATGDWLTLVALYTYGLARNAATFAVGYVKLTDGGGGPFTITAGLLTFATPAGKRFVNTSAGTLALNGTLVLAVQAESPGAAYNVPSGTIIRMLTPLPGVTVSNPLQLGAVAHGGTGSGTVTPSGTPLFSAGVVVKITAAGGLGAGAFEVSADSGESFGASITIPGGGTYAIAGTGITLTFAGTFDLGDTYSFSTSWLTASGTDTESDSALQARCEARWPSLGVAGSNDVYDLWARTASPLVTQTKVRASPTVPGQVDVILAGAAGPVDPTTVVAPVQAYIDPRTPLAVVANVLSATQATVKVSGTLFVHAPYASTALAIALEALNAYVTSAGIGGTVYESDVTAALQDVSGVRNVHLTLLNIPPSTGVVDVVLGDTDVASLDASGIVVVPVA